MERQQEIIDVINSSVDLMRCYADQSLSFGDIITNVKTIDIKNKVAGLNMTVVNSNTMLKADNKTCDNVGKTEIKGILNFLKGGIEVQLKERRFIVCEIEFDVELLNSKPFYFKIDIWGGESIK